MHYKIFGTWIYNNKIIVLCKETRTSVDKTVKLTGREDGRVDINYFSFPPLKIQL